MKKQNIDMLFTSLRAVIQSVPLCESEKRIFSDELLPSLLTLSKKHDLAHLVCYALQKNSILGKNNEISLKFEEEKMAAIYRYERTHAAFSELYAALEESGTSFMPLKGSVMHRYYPEPWMRTSCDIDILIHKEDLEKTAQYLIARLSYRQEQTGSHDVSFFTPSGVHIELHYNLMEPGHAKASAEVLRDVWKASVVKSGYQYWFEMSDAMFCFYHIAHMAKHFETGGCGIRAFLDLWILEHRPGLNQATCDALLEKGDLLTFANAARRLSEVWFTNAESDELSSQMEDFILQGGAYGNQKNRIAIQQIKKGSRFRYAISKIFLSYEELKFHYPILQKHRFLTPFYEIKRWFKLLFRGGLKRSAKELEINRRIAKTQTEPINQFLTGIGL